MWWYVGIAVVCAGLVPWARKRSEGSMTRYTVGTGAPVVIALIGAAALIAAVAQGSGDDDLARELFTGGLVGGALVQFILVRRTYGVRFGQHPGKPGEEGADAEREPVETRDGEPEPDEDAQPTRTP